MYNIDLQIQWNPVFTDTIKTVVFPIHFNPNNSLSILLQISLVFMFTPALRGRPFNS